MERYTCSSEKAMAPHSSTPAWKIPWMEEPGRLQSMGLLRVGHDLSDFTFTFLHWRRKWQPTPVFLPGESQGWGALWAVVSGVAQSWTGLKRLSSSSRKYATIDITYDDSSKTITFGKRNGQFNGMLKQRRFNVVLITREQPKALNMENPEGKLVQYNGKAVSIQL